MTSEVEYTKERRNRSWEIYKGLILSDKYKYELTKEMKMELLSVAESCENMFHEYSAICSPYGNDIEQ